VNRHTLLTGGMEKLKKPRIPGTLEHIDRGQIAAGDDNAREQRVFTNHAHGIVSLCAVQIDLS